MRLFFFLLTLIFSSLNALIACPFVCLFNAFGIVPKEEHHNKHNTPPSSVHVVPDDRTIWRRGLDTIESDPFVTGASVVTTFGSAVWFLSSRYVRARHHITPYVGSQLIKRQWLFSLDSTTSETTALRVGAFSACVALVRSWSRTHPPASWHNKD